MKAVIFEGPDQPAMVREVKQPIPGAKEVLIRIIAASLNRRDFWIKKGIYAGAEFPCIAGSDGSGTVEAVGPEADSGLLNKKVVINPSLNWGNNPLYHQPEFHILGLPRQGTLAQYISVPQESIWEKPIEYTFEQAAALPLAGLTAYRAMFTRGQLQEGEKVLITGAGGGVAGFLVKFASAKGAQVFVTSSHEKKIKKSIQLGATDGVLYTDNEWHKNLKEQAGGGFDLIIDSAAGANFEYLLSLLNTGGRIVIFGGTAGKIPAFTAAKLFYRQASILGTTMGSPEDFKNMLTFIQQNKIFPEIDRILPLEDTELAFKHLENQEQFGKIVIKVSEVIQ